MVSANPTGPITVASARNGAYGDCVARLLEFAGHDVEREYYYNDAGAQMDKFRASVDAARRGEDPPEDGYHGDYIADARAGGGRPGAADARRRSRPRSSGSGSTSTPSSGRASSRREIPEAIALLDTFEEDGALWARTSAHGDEKDRVLVRSDGTPTYFAADAAYVRRKYAKGFDRLVYVLGADHHGYVGRLQALAEMLGHPRDSLEVLIYQLVHLTKGGEATKMSKRRGDVVFLDEFVDEIGDRRRALVPRLAGPRPDDRDRRRPRGGEDGRRTPSTTSSTPMPGSPGSSATPIRTRSLAQSHEVALVGPLAAEERDLVKRLAEFPAVAAEAAVRRAPHAIPTYAIRVADDFHRFYHHHKVLGSPEERFRLGLCTATKNVVARCLDLIGVEAPDRM